MSSLFDRWRVCHWTPRTVTGAGDDVDGDRGRGRVKVGGIVRRESTERVCPPLGLRAPHPPPACTVNVPGSGGRRMRPRRRAGRGQAPSRTRCAAGSAQESRGVARATTRSPLALVRR